MSGCNNPFNGAAGIAARIVGDPGRSPRLSSPSGYAREFGGQATRRPTGIIAAERLRVCQVLATHPTTEMSLGVGQVNTHPGPGATRYPPGCCRAPGTCGVLANRRVSNQVPPYRATLRTAPDEGPPTDFGRRVDAARATVLAMPTWASASTCTPMPPRVGRPKRRPRYPARSSLRGRRSYCDERTVRTKSARSASGCHMTRSIAESA
jgi:hypothetical protein